MRVAPFNHPLDATIGKQQAMFDLVFPVLHDSIAITVLDPFPVIRMNQRQECLVRRRKVILIYLENSKYLARPIQLVVHQIEFPMAHLAQLLCLLQSGALFSQCQLALLDRSDVGTQRDIGLRLAAFIQIRRNGRGDPIQAAILGAIAQLTLPHPALRDPAPHRAKEFRLVDAGLNHAMILSHQFIAAVLAECAELVIHKRDQTLRIRDGHACMLVQRAG